MPSKKIFIILIICAGIVGSLWIFEGKTGASIKNGDLEVLASHVGTSAGGDQNWLTVGDVTGSSTNSVLSYPNEGTVTDNISKDFFSQYLLIIKQNNGELTDEEANQIAQNTLSSPDYLKATGVVYTKQNLHISASTSVEMRKKYVEDIQSILKNRSPKVQEEPLTIVENAMKSGKEGDLVPLDSIIYSDKLALSDLVGMTIPSDAVSFHLSFLNSVSNILANIEAMRQTFVDPVRSFAALNQYQQHMSDIYVALKNIDEYSKSK